MVVLISVMLVPLIKTPAPAAALSLQARAAESVPELDDFGYTSDFTPTEWLEAPDAVNMGDFQRAFLGFPFKFYDQTYTLVDVHAESRLSTSALLAFNQTQSDAANFIKVNFNGPFNLIFGEAATKAGGIAPNRYFLVQWLGARLAYCLRGMCNQSLFFDAQIILQENGNILIHHRGVSPDPNVLTLSMRDWTGLEGLSVHLPRHDTGIASLQVVRPPDQARITVFPTFQSQLTSVSATSTFTFTVQNKGDLMTDTFDIALSSTWPISLYASGGITPLVDTNASGIVDTGPIPQSQAVSYAARLTAPPNAGAGTWNTATITLSSAHEITRQSSITLQTAVPMPFATTILRSLRQPNPEYYQNHTDLVLVEPTGQQVIKLDQPPTLSETWGIEELPSEVAELPSGGYIVAKAIDHAIVYVMTDNLGAALFPERRISPSNLPCPNDLACDLSPSTLRIAVAPSGRIGITFMSYGNSGLVLVFCVLDVSGQVLLPPTILGSRAPDKSYLYRRQVGFAATADSHFVVVWEDAILSGEHTLIGTIRNDDGATVQSERVLAQISASQYCCDSTFKVAAAGNHVFVAGFQSAAIDYLILDSLGQVTTPLTPLYRDAALNNNGRAGQLHVAEIAKDQVGLIWLESRGVFTNSVENSLVQSLRFAVVNADGTSTISPNEIAGLNAGASIDQDLDLAGIPDAAGHLAIFWQEWMPNTSQLQSQINLNYVLVEATGATVTPKTQVESQEFKVGFSQYRFTTHRASPSTGRNLRVSVPALLSLLPGELISIPIRLENSSLATATDVVLTATLGAGVGYVSGISEISPTLIVSQDQTSLVWHLPALSGLSAQQFPLVVRAPMATFGTRVSVQFEIRSSDVDMQPADNLSQMQLWIARSFYLPAVSDYTFLMRAAQNSWHIW